MSQRPLSVPQQMMNLAWLGWRQLAETGERDLLDKTMELHEMLLDTRNHRREDAAELADQVRAAVDAAGEDGSQKFQARRFIREMPKLLLRAPFEGEARYTLKDRDGKVDIYIGKPGLEEDEVVRLYMEDKVRNL